MMNVATMLIACTHAKDLDDKETKLSQSVASAFNMEAPKLMTTDKLPEGSKGGCPKPGKMLTNTASGGAFLDGCYMNTTRSQQRNEATGEEAQAYLYMWKHACAFTRWVPSNQFMYSNLDYDESTMTLERFGFIGMDKRCFWGSIGVLWKRPLPVEQILPNNTIPEPTPVNPVESGIKEGQLFNKKSAKGLCLGVVSGNVLIDDDCKKPKNIWKLNTSGMLKHVDSNLCLSTKKKNNGTPITLEDCDGSQVQKWAEF